MGAAFSSTEILQFLFFQLGIFRQQKDLRLGMDAPDWSFNPMISTEMTVHIGDSQLQHNF